MYANDEIPEVALSGSMKRTLGAFGSMYRTDELSESWSEKLDGGLYKAVESGFHRSLEDMLISMGKYQQCSSEYLKICIYYR